MKIYCPILVTPNTNPIWLKELLTQLSQYSQLLPHTIQGSPTAAGLTIRKAEAILQVPSSYTHIFIIDHDDLISPIGLSQALLELKDSLILQEQAFYKDKLIDSPKVCCRAIVSRRLAMEAASHTLLKGLPDKAYVSYLAEKYNVAVSSQVVYLWRRHDKQASKRGH